MNRASLSGPSAHVFVRVEFEYERPPGSTGGKPPSSIEVRTELPVPSVGEVVMFRDERGSSSGYRVLDKKLWYRSDSQCVVTLSVTDAA